MAEFAAIMAVGREGIVGSSQSPNGMPWSWPEDMRRFQALTRGHVVVMGYKTWEAMGKRALPNRENVVLTGNPAHFEEVVESGCAVATDLQALVKRYIDDKRIVWFIGGPTLLTKALRYCTRFELSLYQGSKVEGDVFLHGGLLEEWTIETVTFGADGLWLKLKP